MSGFFRQPTTNTISITEVGQVLHQYMSKTKLVSITVLLPAYAYVDSTGIQHIASWYGGVGVGSAEIFEWCYQHTVLAKSETHFLPKVTEVFIIQLYRTAYTLILDSVYEIVLFNLMKIYFDIW